MSINQPHGEFRTAGDGSLLLSGELSMATVPELLEQLSTQGALRNAEGEILIDLQGVERADSAGLALLIEWQRLAGQQQKSIRFCNIPAQMLAIARLSGVDELLSLS